MKLILIYLLIYNVIGFDMLDKFNDILDDDNLTDSIKSMLQNKDENNIYNLNQLFSNFKE